MSQVILNENTDACYQEKDIHQTSLLFKSISHPLRLKILCLLVEGSQSVGDLLAVLGTTQSNISQHLIILHNRGLVSSQKKENFVLYQISDPRIQHLILMIEAVFCGMSDHYVVESETS